eukprot:2294490-Pyramimonas_sp.AAC.1
MAGTPSYAAREVQQCLGNMRLPNGEFRRFMANSVANEPGPIFVGSDKNSCTVKKDIALKAAAQLLRERYPNKKFYKDVDTGE